MIKIILLYALGLIIVLALSVEDARSEARVIDGDTIVVDNVHYRLEGIDAPELHQTCAYNWPAGANAARFLRTLLRHGTPVCITHSRDRYGRSLAVCTINGIDLGSAMVRAGYAFAYTTYSKRYVSEELAAKQDAIGVHNFACEKPWDWRHHHE